MNPIRSTWRWLLATAVIVLSGCVDNSFRIDEVSTEVTIADGTTELPLGRLDSLMVGDFINNQLDADENGNYSYGFTGSRESFKIDGFNTTIELPKVDSSFDIEFPSFSLGNNGFKLDEEDDIEVDLSNLEDYMFGGTEFTIPNIPGFSYPKFQGSYNNEFKYDDAHLHFDVPEQIDDIHKIYFRDIENGHHGAPIHISLNLNDIAGVNGGGTIWFTLKQGGGKFTLLDRDNNQIFFGDTYTTEYKIESGAENIDFVVYVESITNDKALNPDHSLDVDLSMSCDLQFEIQTKPGTFGTKKMPHIEVTADFEYGDAEVVLNNNVDIIDYDGGRGFDVSIKDLPEEIVSINNIALKPNTELTLYTDGLEWLGDNADAIEVVITLPDYLALHRLENVEYEYSGEEHKITTTIADISDGLSIGLDAIDFGDEGLYPEDGAIKLHFAPTIKAHFTSDNDVRVSKLMPEAEALTIAIGIESVEMSMASVSGRVDYDYSISEVFELENGFNLDGLTIEALGIAPILTFNITNPLTLPIDLEGAIVCDGRNRLDIGKIELPAAKYVGGEIVPAQCTFVLSDEKRREEFSGSDAIFVAVDFNQLINGNLPSEFAIDFKLGVSPEQVNTFYLADGFEVEYDYAFELPFEVDNTLEFVYEDEFMGLADIFEMLADYNVKVGDITIIAEVHNTTPLSLGAEVQLLTLDGEAATVELLFEDDYAVVAGSHDGATPAVSTLRLKIKDSTLGGGVALTNLVGIDGIHFKLIAQSDAEGSVALNEQQWVAATLSLELAGGVTVDIKDFMN